MAGAPPGCLAAVLLVAVLLVLPFFLAELLLGALGKLGLSPGASLLAVVGIFAGGLVNIPVRRVERESLVPVDPIRALYGLQRLAPAWMRRRTTTIIAVNVGGCLVPSGIAFYELARLAAAGAGALAAGLAAVVVNAAVCYRLARPIPQVGIAMPPLVPALVAAACGLLLVREMAPMIAFSAGVLGPVIGADLLHLREVERTHTGIASIGGAGTFDGIVISGLAATLLA